MECADADTLAALVADALSESDRAAIADHAAACDRCHALIEGLVDGAGTDETLDSSKRSSVLRLAAGAHVGRYVIGERLGAGGMGVVFAAVDSELQRRVAVKVLRPDVRGQLGTDGRERLLREAQILASLSHPNVITVFDVGTHDGHLFLAMELITGGSLSTWLRRKPRTTDEIIDRLIEAGRGLAAAHAAGVVHRDVKPDNILVGLDGRTCMTDFGLARFENGLALVTDKAASAISLLGSPDLTQTGTLMGTPVYMAPEQMMRGDTEPRTDQWSFCALLYEVLAGVRPFAVDDVATRSSAISEGRLAAPARGHHVPAWVRRIVTRGLRADPAERWPSMDAVLGALVRGRQRRSRAAKALAVFGGIALASVAIIALAPPDGPSQPAKVSIRPQRWTDLREGCNCPYSACNGRCVSVCRASDYVLGMKLPGVGSDQSQEALLGASTDGNTILYLTGKGCAIDRLVLARRRGSTFESVDVTDKLDLPRDVILEGCCTLAADGQSLILPAQGRSGFVRLRLSGVDVLAPDGAEFAALIPRSVNNPTVRFPVLAADGLTLYYKLDDPAADGEPGPMDGSYVSSRSDPRAAFPPGHRLTGQARAYEYVTGVSSDGLSLFMASEFQTHVLVRASVGEAFTVPAPGLTPALLPGWRAVPLGDCSRIVTTWTPGGCAGEEIVYLEATQSEAAR